MQGLPHVTECFLIRDGRVMLGRKKRGLGAGKIVGIGGKLDVDETTLGGAIRELREETGVEISEAAMQFRGQVEWRFPNMPKWEMIASVYVAEHWVGEPEETEEIAPVWFAFEAVPWQMMWADACLWVPLVLRGGRADWTFVYNPDNATIARMAPRLNVK